MHPVSSSSDLLTDAEAPFVKPPSDSEPETPSTPDVVQELVGPLFEVDSPSPLPNLWSAPTESLVTIEPAVDDVELDAWRDDTSEPFVPIFDIQESDYRTRGVGRKRVTVLAVDGGGVRGVIPARILEEIIKRTGKPVHESFNIHTGTSAGAMILAGLNTPCPGDEHGCKYKPHDIAERFIEDADLIFPQSTLRNITTMWGALRPRYPSTGIEALLEEYLGETRMSEALADNFIVPAFDTVSYTMGYFSKKRSCNDPDFADVMMRDAVRASTAAPSYFDAHDMRIGKRDYSFVDGGLSCNNPVMYGFCEALHRAPSASDIVVCSIGTGRVSNSHFSKEWGAIDWAPKLVDAVIAGQSDVADVHMRHLLGGGVEQQYFRFQPVISPAQHRFDEVRRENLISLYDVAEAYIEVNDDEIRELCRKLDPDAPYES